MTMPIRTFLLASSTNGEIIPEEWTLPAFWAPFAQILAAQDADADDDDEALFGRCLEGDK